MAKGAARRGKIGTVTDEFPTNVFTRVCHVKQGFEDRERHIIAEFGRRGVPVHFYLDWDVPEISDEIRQDLFMPNTIGPVSASLILKHVGIWRDFLKTDLSFCLVFEDDVFLANDFVSRLNQCIAEFGDPDRKAAVYLGNGGNYYVSWRQITKGRHLYPATHARCTDSYLITRPVAEARLSWLAGNKCGKPIDHLIELIDTQEGVEFLWFERPIVEQGSQNGTFHSAASTGKWRPLWYKRLEWTWKKYRHRLFGYG